VCVTARALAANDQPPTTVELINKRHRVFAVTTGYETQRSKPVCGFERDLRAGPVAESARRRTCARNRRGFDCSNNRRKPGPNGERARLAPGDAILRTAPPHVVESRALKHVERLIAGRDRDETITFHAVRRRSPLAPRSRTWSANAAELVAPERFDLVEPAAQLAEALWLELVDAHGASASAVAGVVSTQPALTQQRASAGLIAGGSRRARPRLSLARRGSCAAARSRCAAWDRRAAPKVWSRSGMARARRVVANALREVQW